MTNKRFLVLTIICLAGVVTYLAGFSAGAHSHPGPYLTASTSHYAQRGDVPEVAADTSGGPLERQFQVFWEVWDLLEQEFCGPLPGKQERIYGAIRGMVASVGDSHTTFLTPQQTSIISKDDSGSFEGIGASIRLDDEIHYPRIVHLFDSQPAARAGLRPGDIILEIDNMKTEAMTLLDVIALIRGPEGSTVHLTIRRESANQPEPFEVSVTREHIDIPIVEAEMLADRIAYLRLTDFNSTASPKLTEALKALLAEQPAGLILDLRGNPGGFLHVAVEVASQFVPEGTVIVTEKNKDGDETTFAAQPGGRGLASQSELALVVLVDEGTASAAEIVAAAIQDANRGILMGQPTFGKSSVQIPHELSDGSELRVTIARWFTPNGRTIDGGLLPDIEASISLEDIQAERDPQKDRALEYLRPKP